MDRHHFQANHLFSSAANSVFGSRRNSEVVEGGGSSHVARTDTCTINPFMKREQQINPGCPGGDVNQQLAPSFAVTNDHDKNYFFRSQQDMGIRRHEEGDDVAEHQGNNTPLLHHHIMGSSKDTDSIKAKIIVHPQYASMLEAYIDCQKIGAPPEIVARLSAVSREWEQRHRSSANETVSENDPELDQFMGAYYDMLVKYREELSRSLQEAMQFLRNVESQLNSLRDGSAGPKFSMDDRAHGVGSSEKGGSGDEETELVEVDPQAEETELKERLLRKYSGYLGSLKQELSRKKKNGRKLPKEARQKLLNWWEFHYKWPYPSESEKVSLAESTGLDQKQINNWFINQRKRHWKPSDNMQFVVMDGPHPHHNTTDFFVHNHCTMGGAESTPFRFGPA